MTRDELWSRLAVARLVSGPMPVATSSGSPWYVSAMVGAAGWVASFFLLAFFGMAFSDLLRSAGGSLAVGAVLCVVCAVVMHARGERLFASQFAVAVSLAGQALLAYGILDHHWRSPMAWLAFAVVEGALVAVAPNYVHRVLSTIACACAVRFALAHAGIAALFPPLVAGAFFLAWTAARRRAHQAALWRPILAGLAIAALLVVPASLAEEILAWTVRTPPLAGALLSWIGALALVGVLLAAIAALLRDSGARLNSRPAVLAFAAGAAVALAARPVPGLVVALIVLLVSFSEGRRALMGLAIVGMIGALVHHYYALDATLLAKSAAFLAMGIVLAVAGIAVRLGLADEQVHRA